MTGVSHLQQNLHDRGAFEKLIRDMGQWISDNKHVTFALERMQDAPAFSSEDRRKFKKEIALYRRADAARRLIKKYYVDLYKLPVTADALLIEPLLANFMRALQEWLDATPDRRPR